ncbi:MAG TPA: single-stranded DNA-binding protein [Solirubrobacteraceae bacterium]|nr:single-stranded DNA-binding protein [Solirubrobacteraceae bacterium]
MSAPNINSVTLVGQLTADPELCSMPDGRSVCDLRLAVNDQRDKPALFVDVATFGPGADACAEHLSKGRQVGVIGRLIYSEWEAEDGSKRSKHSVIGRVAFGGKSDDVPPGGGTPDE